MAFNINDIRANMALGGARPSQFNVLMTSPPGGLGVAAAAIAKIPFVVMAASIPETAIGTIQLPYFGRKIKVPGDRTYQPWTVQVLCDEDFLVRNFFETWDANINSPIGNLRSGISSATAEWQATAQVIQYSKTGLPIRIYEMQSCWPSQVSPVELAWGSTDQIEIFNVTFEYDEWVLLPGPTGDGGPQ
jgi:hypothetical protein